MLSSQSENRVSGGRNVCSQHVFQPRTGEFMAKSVQDDLVRLLNPSTIPSTSAGVDPASTICAFQSLYLPAVRDLVYHSSTESTRCTILSQRAPHVPFTAL